MRVHEIRYAEETEEELRKIIAYHRQRILDAVDAQLRHEPSAQTRRRYPIFNIRPDFAVGHPPLWQLKVGDFRVFYDIDEENRKVSVLAVRRKLKGATTEEVLRHEDD